MAQQLELLSIADLAPAADNIRAKPGDVAELAASIAAVGILEPLIATRTADGYEVICGTRRLAAAKAAGLADVPVIVRELDERERLEAMLIENLQRADISPMEEARAFRRLVDVGLTQRDLAKRIGRSQGHISKRLALLALPAPVTRQLDAGTIGVEVAGELGRLGDYPDRIEALLVEITQDSYLTEPDELRYAVSSVLATAERESKIDKVRAELSEKGKPYIEWDKARKNNKAKLITPRFGYSELPGVEPRAHSKEPCHSTTIDPGDAKAYAVCTDAGRHAKNGASTLKAKTAPAVASGVDATQRAEAKGRKEAAAHRVTTLQAIIKARLSTKDLLARVAPALAESLSSDECKIVIDLLGLEPIKYRGYTDARATVAKHLASGPKGFLDVAHAAAFAVWDMQLRYAYRDWKSGNVRTYFEFLKAHGYEPTPFEQKKLKPKGIKKDRANGADPE